MKYNELVIYSNTEANASGFLEILEEMSPLYWIEIMNKYLSEICN